MHILVIDGGHVETEFRAKFGPGHEYDFFSTDVDVEHTVEAWESFHQRFESSLTASNVVFDFTGRIHNSPLRDHEPMPPVFQEASGAFTGFYGLTDTAVFGFCGLPTLLNRPLLEVSLYHEADREKLAETCAALGTDYRVVADRVGLVTPRVICQIINEAYYTVQEGTATRADVDLAMKLGTNYPHGPFAWAQAIGVQRVYYVLEALWNDTHDERYKVCPLLKREALRG